MGGMKMSFHVWPGAIDSRHPIPVAKILKENWLFGKNDVGEIDELHGGQRLISMVSKLAVLLDGIEDDVYWM